jgi:hypothetical protein
VTDFLFRWWWLVLLLAWPGFIVLVCHIDRLCDRARLWWWRR